MPASNPKTRIEAADWLRGLAVLAMIQCHTLGLLQDRLRSTDTFHWLRWLDGLVAPAFLFTAGFALGLVQVRSAPQPLPRRTRAGLKRIGRVLLAATFVNALWFNFLVAPHRIFRIDILHCIGLSLLVALPFALLLARRPRLLGGVALLVGLALFTLAPLGDGVTGPLAGLFNRRNDTVFPLLPWVGHLFLGLSAGVLRTRGALIGWLLLLAVLGAVGHALTPELREAYPKHDFWLSNPAQHAERFSWVARILAGLLLLEHLWKTTGLQLGVGRPLAWVGAASLSGYVIHQALLFLPLLGRSPARALDGRLDFGTYTLATVALIAATLLGCRAWEWLSAPAQRERLGTWFEALDGRKA